MIAAAWCWLFQTIYIYYSSDAVTKLVLLCRLMMGSVVRAQMQQTKAFDFGKDAAQSTRAHATFNQVV